MADVERRERGGAGDPPFWSHDGGVDALFVDVSGHGRSFRERRGQDGWGIAIAVERCLEVNAEVRDLRDDASLEWSEAGVCRWPAERGHLAVDDGSDQVQCFDDGALTGVVPTDNNRISMKRDGMVVEATIILKTKRA